MASERPRKPSSSSGRKTPAGESRALTSRQQRFVEVYAGNGTQAARLAGYKGSDNVLAQTARDLLRNPQISEAIRAREKEEVRPLIATRQQRQEFWTRVMNDENEEMPYRLKASELLGKSEADFTDKVDLGGELKLSHEDALGALE